MTHRIFVYCFALLSFLACNKEEQITDLTDETLNSLVVETRAGSGGCYEIVFPIAFDLADGSVIEAESISDARTQIRNWFQSDPEVIGRPVLQYPIDMINEDGEVITVVDRSELVDIRKACFRENLGEGKPCFRLVYPIGIEYPDGTVIEYEKWRDARLALREWKLDNLDAEERPKLDFPIEVVLDGAEEATTVNSREELRQIKEDC